MIGALRRVRTTRPTYSVAVGTTGIIKQRYHMTTLEDVPHYLVVPDGGDWNGCVIVSESGLEVIPEEATLPAELTPDMLASLILGRPLRNST